jgi:hypothetical protein
MLSQETAAPNHQIETWNIDRLIFHARNPRKNDAAVDRMCGSIREFGFKIPVLARSDEELAILLGGIDLADLVPGLLCERSVSGRVELIVRLMVDTTAAIQNTEGYIGYSASDEHGDGVNGATLQGKLTHFFAVGVAVAPSAVPERSASCRAWPESKNAPRPCR